MIMAEQIPDVVWRVAMMTYHREIRRHPEQAWQLAIAAAMTSWPGCFKETTMISGDKREYALILPLTAQEAGDE